MNILPKALEDLIDAFSVLPGVGSKSAERYATALFRSNPNNAKKLSKNLADLHENVTLCPKTFALIDKSSKLSPLYTDSKRDKETVMVLAEPLDILAIERTNNYKGTYHILGGLISPIDNVHPEDLTITELVKRIKEDEVKEVIFALNASIEGETTILYIQKQLENNMVSFSRLAYGLPVGLELGYADQLTITRALEGRTSL